MTGIADDLKNHVGIVGGGQLARMLTEAAAAMNVKVTVLDPTLNCPAAQVGAEQIVAGHNDAEAIAELAKITDVVTIDFEHISAEALASVSAAGHSVQPSPDTVSIIQDKLKQSEFLLGNDLPLADFRCTETLDDAKRVWLEFEAPMILKKRFHSYDGKGNAVVKELSDLKHAWNSLGGDNIFAQKLIDFERELSVIVARDTRGKTVVYPVVQTVHVDNICHEVFLPGDFDGGVVTRATRIAQDAVNSLDGAGVFAIEMFLSSGEEILINEIAPRVHNSGHPTIEGCITSQFTQHICAITGRELGSTAMKVPTAVMINILGTRDGEARPKGIDKAEALGNIYVHLYGKQEVKVGRKMGHITATADTLESAKLKAEQAFEMISI